MIHTNVKTNKGSFLDSAVRIPDLVKKCQGAVAICDTHFFGVFDFWQECQKNNIKPIIGFEVVYENYRLLVYAKNLNGYNNLVDFKNGKHSELKSVVVVVPRIGGILSHLLEKTSKPEKDIDEYLQHFKKNFTDVYLEITDCGIRYEKGINELIIKAGKRNDIKVIASSNAVYLEKKDKGVHNLLQRIKDNKRNDSSSWVGDFYLKNENEFSEYLKEYLNNTDEFASKFENYSILQNNGKYFMPSNEGDDLLVLDRCTRKLSEIGKNNDKYLSRLKTELSVINKENYAGYFVVVADVCDWCRKNEVLVGVGRGSAGGSLVAYLMGITGVDPLDERCELYFERFLNPDRISPPDIDVDVSDRDKVIGYIRNKYGDDRVVNIGTLMSLGTRASLREVARIYNFTDFDLKRLQEIYPQDNIIKETNAELYEKDPSVRRLIDNNPSLKNVWEYACRIEGLYKTCGVHASGIVISPVRISFPVAEREGVFYSELEMDSVEKLGYIKFDFLGLKTLGIIDRTLKKIEKNGNKVDIYSIDHWGNDEKTMALLHEGMTACIFQFDGQQTKELLKKIKPSDFNELADITDLIRPGPMDSGLTSSYIKRKLGEEPITYIHPALEKINLRKGLTIYQEDVMRMCQVLSGFTMAEADTVRKGIGKKDFKILSEMKPKFIEGAKTLSQIGERESEEIWSMLEYFGNYSFNLSHATAYTVISYWCAYLSAHYPCEFFASNLDSAADGEKIAFLVAEAKKRGIKVYPPNINKSENEYIADGDKIYSTLGSVKGIGDKTKEAILEERTKGSFHSFQDFEIRTSGRACTSANREMLIYAGVFDIYYPNDEPYVVRKRLLAETLKGKSEKLEKLQTVNSLGFIEMEREVLGFYFTKDPIEYLKADIYNSNIGAFQVLQAKKIKDKNGKDMAFITVTNYEDDYEIILFSSLYEKFALGLSIGNICIIEYKWGNGGKMIVENVDVAFSSGKIHNWKTKYLPVVDFQDDAIQGFDFDRFVVLKDQEKRFIMRAEGSGEIKEKYVKGYRKCL